jgi:phospholipid/cholesterol/gamma-HCH transport system ATP-binding protein
MAYGDFVVQKGLTFDINPHDIFIIMGGSGCGKSTLLKHFIGLKEPAEGRVLFHADDQQNQRKTDYIDFWQAEDRVRQQLMQRCGVLYQSGAYGVR